MAQSKFSGWIMMNPHFHSMVDLSSLCVNVYHSNLVDFRFSHETWWFSSSLCYVIRLPGRVFRSGFIQGFLQEPWDSQRTPADSSAGRRSKSGPRRGVAWTGSTGLGFHGLVEGKGERKLVVCGWSLVVVVSWSRKKPLGAHIWRIYLVYNYYNIG